jgi:hypothetical protein
MPQAAGSTDAGLRGRTNREARNRCAGTASEVECADRHGEEGATGMKALEVIAMTNFILSSEVSLAAGLRAG